MELLDSLHQHGGDLHVVDRANTGGGVETHEGGEVLLNLLGNETVLGVLALLVPVPVVCDGLEFAAQLNTGTHGHDVLLEGAIGLGGHGVAHNVGGHDVAAAAELGTHDVHLLGGVHGDVGVRGGVERAEVEVTLDLEGVVGDVVVEHVVVGHDGLLIVLLVPHKNTTLGESGLVGHLLVRQAVGTLESELVVDVVELHPLELDDVTVTVLCETVNEVKGIVVGHCVTVVLDTNAAVLDVRVSVVDNLVFDSCQAHASS